MSFFIIMINEYMNIGAEPGPSGNQSTSNLIIRESAFLNLYKLRSNALYVFENCVAFSFFVPCDSPICD
jgi:hypothetical protein